MARPRISVTEESETGRNEMFHDNYTDVNMTREQFVRQIEASNYPNYHIREINGVKTPAANPDQSELNNLG